jgi:hypothetical protein
LVTSSSSSVCPLYSGFPSPKTKFRHLSLSLVSSSLSPWFVILRLTPSIHLSLCLPLLRVPSGSHSKMFSGSLVASLMLRGCDPHIYVPQIDRLAPNDHNFVRVFPVQLCRIMHPGDSDVKIVNHPQKDAVPLL